MTYKLHPDRFFDPDPTTRKIARQLYEQVCDLPIISPHGHTDPHWFAENKPFSDPTELIIVPDHYVFRLLYSQGIKIESLGVPTVDGIPVESDRRKIWRLFARHFYLFDGTPTGAWLSYEFTEIFGVNEKLTADNADRIYDHISGLLNRTEFLPRSIVDRFNIEVLSTTDEASDQLLSHQKIRKSDWNGRIIPCFRPDAVTNIRNPHWKNKIDELSNIVGYELNNYSHFIRALEDRRLYFKSMGATATDQGILSPFTIELNKSDCDIIYQRALNGTATEDDALQFSGQILMEMARMSIEDGLVMQIHPGSFRNHNKMIYNRFGHDMGADIPVRTEYTRNLHTLLNKYGNDPRLTLIVFTLDESTYSRELAPLAGHYPAMKLGPSWWFHDSIEGMMRFRRMTTETASIYNTVGFNDDTRALLSIPARHDLSRRVDSNYLATLVATHRIDMDSALRMSKALAYDLAKQAYKL
ncbi:MAG: glucuronate isomerase [Candidatus Marinimicrobia bacterium]|nr:glucuronate isomerase [Candidatus Neomarinimicrobiota bacterium]